MSRTPRVVEAALRTFQCAYEGYEEDPFALGAFVVVREGAFPALGVVVDAASGPEDPSRPLQPRGGAHQTAADVLAENQEIRLLLRTRVTVVSCGYVAGEAIRPALPPAPPPLLGLVALADRAEVRRLTEDAAFLALLVASPLCDDAVVAAAIRSGARAFAADERDFLVGAGKELARLLRAEPARLASILRGVAG